MTLLLQVTEMNCLKFIIIIKFYFILFPNIFIKLWTILS